MSSRNCPFFRCGNKVEGSNFCCPEHWLRVPDNLRTEAYEAFASYARQEITQAELCWIQKRIADETEGRISEHKRGQGFKSKGTYKYCPACRTPCFLATVASTHQTLLDLKNDELGTFVVVGGTAFTGPVAMQKKFESPGLALLRPHVCSKPKRLAEIGHARDATRRRTGTPS